MKTVSEIYNQYQRICSALAAAKRNNILKADPQTDGIEMLAHNWGNDAAKKAIQDADKRRYKIGAIYEEAYFKAFKMEYPDHIISKLDKNPNAVYLQLITP